MLSVLGALLGVLASFINQNDFLGHSFLGPMATTYGYWVIFGSTIALGSKTALRAGINCLLFFLLMNTAFYCFEWLTTGTFLLNYLIRWVGMTVLTLFGGWLVWHLREPRWLGIIAAAAPVCLLLAESIEILAGLGNDKIVQVDGLWQSVPTNAWYIGNNILTAAIYLVFAGYLIHLFPKTKKRVLWLAGVIAVVIAAYLLRLFVL